MADKQASEIIVQENKQLPEIEISEVEIKNLIYVIRGQQVMLDSDLATLYGVGTKALNRAMKRNLPYVFTEQGISMLSAVLHSETAVNVSIGIMRAFVEMRKFLTNNSLMFERINDIEVKQLAYHIGASIKDAGKKCFGISLIEDDRIIKDIIERLNLESEELDANS